MRAFQTVFAALAAAVVNGQIISRSYGLDGIGLSYGSGLYGLSYSPAFPYGSGYNARYSTVSAAPAISYRTGYPTVAAAPAISYRIAAPAAPTISYSVAPAVPYAVAPIATRKLSVAPASIAARTVSVADAPALTHATPAQAVNIGVVATAGTPSVRSHEIHTGSGRQAIRIEDFQAGDQVIRVHEGPQAAPEVSQIAVPGDQHHVRVIEHQSGPAQIERVVTRGQTQVVDVQKPGRPGARIVQVVKGQSPPPTIEFVQDGGSSHHVYYADDVNAGGAIGSGATTFATSYAPVVGATAPVTAYTTSVNAVPAVSYASYSPITYGTYGLGGFGFGGLGYSTGYTPYTNGNNVFLDAKKKASAKKSA
ncbi:hypothetical protein BIW11_08768 [Tropilaelaps mercedesae]|uniref:Uncharacterized protein n=1 Tax=Tropilaelaps mercedesae TaxID=418985 RepID=A0A1V9XN80_9ACAR|nr:hypothetical protein BIW11_08768 [Tropilaelaps mercedesae]